ncbi:MAG: hypothetical protein ACLU9S_06200 [Oscillospiraceae bacterium]
MEAGTFAREHVFYIDGFSDFTAQEMAVLAHLIGESPCVTVSLVCDGPGSQTPGHGAGRRDGGDPPAFSGRPELGAEAG